MRKLIWAVGLWLGRMGEKLNPSYPMPKEVRAYQLGDSKGSLHQYINRRGGRETVRVRDVVAMFRGAAGGSLGSYEILNQPPHFINCLVQKRTEV